MTFSQRTLKTLWGRAAGRCSMANCRIQLAMDISETDDPALVGENCHIVAREDDGPRGDASFPVDRRDLYGNLILLCATHHTLIDKAPSTFTVEELHQIKTDHEEWVVGQLGTDEALQKDEEYYAGLVDDWEKRFRVDAIGAWSSWLISEQPRMRRDLFDQLSENLTWLASRIWPVRYPDLEGAFENFRLVLQDLLRLLYEDHDDDKEDHEIRVRRFYRIREWDEELYSYLVGKFGHHNNLIGDLTLELIRAANLICDRFRKHILSSYRIKEGAILIGLDPLIDHSIHERRPQYTAEEGKRQIPYQGLDDFIDTRGGRSFRYGSGSYPEYVRVKPK